MNKFFLKKRKILFSGRGFTIIELIVVIAIIAILAGIVIFNIGGILENAKVSAAGSVQRQMTEAVQLYYNDMGFYPPDVNRGCDPGLVKSMPWNPDTLPTDTPYPCDPDPACDHCPANWEQIVQQNWAGPYLSQWPETTPWGGKYDYNYWDTPQDRGCGSVPFGIYMGVEGDYTGGGLIPQSAETKMAQYGFDADCSTNGEAQMPLVIF